MIDFHTHSAFSDGTDTPERLVELGTAEGLAALALTDHDTVAGLARFLACQSRTPVRLVPGIELSCRFMERELHLLGLFVDPFDGRFLERLDRLRLRRETRNRRMVQRLAEVGRSLDLDRLQAQAPGGLITRTHFALALVEEGHARTPREAFHRFLADDAPGYVPMEPLEPGEAALWIREAGGVAVVAHPGRFAGGRFVWDQALAHLKAQGLQAIEAFYSEHAPHQERYFLDLADDLGLAVSGGSDYHGAAKPGLALGRGWGSLRVPDECLHQLEALRSASPASMKAIEVQA